MYNKCNNTIIEALKQNKVYIIKYIIKSFSKFALIFIIYTLHSKTIFSAAVLDANLQN